MAQNILYGEFQLKHIAIKLFDIITNFSNRKFQVYIFQRKKCEQKQKTQTIE